MILIMIMIIIIVVIIIITTTTTTVILECNIYYIIKLDNSKPNRCIICSLLPENV